MTEGTKMGSQTVIIDVDWGNKGEGSILWRIKKDSGY